MIIWYFNDDDIVNPKVRFLKRKLKLTLSHPSNFIFTILNVSTGRRLSGRKTSQRRFKNFSHQQELQSLRFFVVDDSQVFDLLQNNT